MASHLSAPVVLIIIFVLDIEILCWVNAILDTASLVQLKGITFIPLFMHLMRLKDPVIEYRS